MNRSQFLRGIILTAGSLTIGKKLAPLIPTITEDVPGIGMTSFTISLPPGLYTKYDILRTDCTEWLVDNTDEKGLDVINVFTGIKQRWNYANNDQPFYTRKICSALPVSKIGDSFQIAIEEDTDHMRSEG